MKFYDGERQRLDKDIFTKTDPWRRGGRMDGGVTVAVFLVLFVAPCLHAAPRISAVSGTIAHGGSLTISGSDFGVKSPAAPYVWANFDDGSAQPSVLGTQRSWTVANFTPTAGVGVRNTVGMQSYLWNYQEQNFNALMGLIPSDYSVNTVGQRTYIFRKGKRNFAFPSVFNWKNLRLWYGSGSFVFQTSNGAIDEDAGGHGGGYMCAWQSPTSAQCTDGITVEQTRGYSDGRWNTEEILIGAQSAPGATDGNFKFIVNGRLAGIMPYFDYNQKYLTLASGAAGDHWFVHDDNVNDDPPAGAQTWADDVYVDRTWSRVMLSNRSTWGTSSTGPLYEIQIPTGWSDTSITVQFNQGEFQNGATVYLYVVDANNDANPNGYPITIAGGGTTPPAAPRGLRVD